MVFNAIRDTNHHTVVSIGGLPHEIYGKIISRGEVILFPDNYMFRKLGSLTSCPGQVIAALTAVRDSRNDKAFHNFTSFDIQVQRAYSPARLPVC